MAKLTDKNRLSITHPELCKELNYDKCRDLKPENFSCGSNIKVPWKCKNGHEYKSSIISRTRTDGKASGCPYCSGNKVCIDNCLATKRPDLAKEWSKNNKLTPFDFTCSSSMDADWECPNGHVYNSKINSRTNMESGCPYCSGNKVCIDNCLATKRPDLAKEWSKNNKLTPFNVTCSSRKKAEWECIFGHLWFATVASRNSGTGCPYCSGKKVCIDNCLATKRPDLAKEWSSKNKLNPFQVTSSSSKKAIWECEFNHEYEATINSRFFGNGCPFCSGHRVCLENSLATLRPDLAKEWSKNNKLTPFDVTCGSSIEAEWECLAKRHLYKSSICSRTSMGSGCPYCCGQKVCLDNCLATLRPDLIKNWSLKNKLTPFNVTCGSNIEAIWKCEKDHEYKMSICNVTKGNQCPYCCGKKACIDNCLATKRPDLAKEWHLTLNGNLTPFDVTCGSEKRPYWKCLECENEWKATILSRVSGCGCPKCKESRGEKQTAKILDLLGVKFKRQWKEHFCKNKRKLPFDFYLEDFNRCIEYQGIQHYEEKSFGSKKEINNLELIQKNDLIKLDYCTNNNIPLLRIPYWDFFKIKELVKEFLNIIQIKIL